MDFTRIQNDKVELKKGQYSLSLGKCFDYFNPKRSFNIEGYLFWPLNPKVLVVFQSDLMSVGNKGYAVELARSLQERNIAVLTFDNSGMFDLGGKSDGELRDYMPEQISSDIIQVAKFIDSSLVFSRLKKVFCSISYGCVPLAFSLDQIFYLLDGLILISYPKSGKDIFEKFYKRKLVRNKTKEGLDVFSYHSTQGETKQIPKIFFSRVIDPVNNENVLDNIYDVIIPARITVKLIIAEEDEILGKTEEEDGGEFKIIPWAKHNFLDEWTALIDEIVNVCREAEQNNESIRSTSQPSVS